MSADAIGRAVAHPKARTDGWRMTSVPIKLAKIAPSRRILSCSPSNNADNNVRIIGCMKKIDMASAMGSVFSAAKKKAVAAASNRPRIICSSNVPFGIAKAPNAMIKGSISTVCMKNRQKVISSQPHSAPKSLANASSPGIISIEMLIRAMPTPGRCICRDPVIMPACCAQLVRCVNPSDPHVFLIG